MNPAPAPDAIPRSPLPSPGGPVRPVRALAAWAIVMLVTVLILFLVDSVPGWISGMPKGVTSVGTVEQAERNLRAHLRLPAYFPDSLRWPPIAVNIYPGPPAAAALTFAGSVGSEERLIVCQTLEPAESVPVRLLPPGLILEAARTNVGDQPGTLTRIQLDDGRVMHELTWRDQERVITLRFDGAVDQLMTMAQSLTRDRS